MRNTTRLAASVAAVVALSMSLTAMSSPVLAGTSSKTCAGLGYKTTVKVTKLRYDTGRSYGEIRTLSKASSPTSWCTYVVKNKKDRKNKHWVELKVSSFRTDPDRSDKYRTAGKVKKRSKALTYSVASEPLSSGRPRVLAIAKIKIGKKNVRDGSIIR